ncbi:MAG: DUF3631 domain-containing protein [Alphaproteobacteria bacterium]|nr:DUF3631 domain-containing protein [Alphaproteobacteria bacterium]
MDSNKFYTRIIKEARTFTAKDVKVDPRASGVWYWLLPNEKGMFITQRFDNAEGKSVIPSYYNGEEWIQGQAFNPTPLYNLGIFTKYKDRKVLIVEGEKAANAAQKLLGDDYWVTTWCGGVGQVGKVSVLPLEGRRVYLWPDNDEPGKSAMQKMAQRLHKEAKAAEVYIVNVPANFPEKWDLADETPEGWTVEKLRQLIVDAPEVAEKAEGDQSASTESQTDEFGDLKPYPEPVDGTELIAEIKAVLNKYMVLPEYLDEAIAYWVLFTYGINSFEVSPRLAIVSPEKQCGKSTLLAILEALCWNTMTTSNASAASLYRTIEAKQPTFLIDEADSFMNQNEALRNIFNAGFTPDTPVIRTEGEHHEPREFNVFSACAIACIGKLPDTIMDRSIIVTLKRKTSIEVRDRLRRKKLKKEVETIKCKCMRLMDDISEILKDAEPELPEELCNRQVDIWEPLVAIADCIGKEAGKKLRKVAVAVCCSTKTFDSNSIKTLLLKDIRKIFAGTTQKWMTSQDLCNKLCSLEDAPWAEYKGTGLTVNKLASALKDFDIHPIQKMTPDGNKKVYLLERFHDTFNRYLLSETVNYKSSQTADPNDLYSDL